ncbi:MAG: hypothetical protein H9535_02945 [Ignavibacteria bacterium]|nr:hypothetical protein [Ignavibacteria bacterium]MBL7990703.1 hypothetical protein [Candidatus Kapabacteria bacterium]
MNAHETIESSSHEQTLHEQEFPVRMDFYWQAIALYALALICYALVRGTVWDGSLNLTLRDPIVIVLGALVIGSCFWSLGNWYMRRSIVIGDSYIRFTNRFRSRTFRQHDIDVISIGRQKMLKVRGVYKLVKIRLRSRRRLLRIRPSLYEQEQALVQSLIALKRQLTAR